MTVITMSRNELMRLRVLIDVATDACPSQMLQGLLGSDEDRSAVYWMRSKLMVWTA